MHPFRHGRDYGRTEPTPIPNRNSQTYVPPQYAIFTIGICDKGYMYLITAYVFKWQKYCNLAICPRYLSTFLSKYRFHDIINTMLLPSPRLCSKGKWIATVERTIRSSAYLWTIGQRMSSDPDSTFYRILQPCICPSVVYMVLNNSSFSNNIQYASSRTYDAVQLYKCSKNAANVTSKQTRTNKIDARRLVIGA